MERQEFLQWVLELIEKLRCPDDGILKLILPLSLQYLGEFVQSELLSRKLAHQCARKLNQLCSESAAASPRTQSPLLSTNTNG